MAVAMELRALSPRKVGKNEKGGNVVRISYLVHTIAYILNTTNSNTYCTCTVYYLLFE